MSRSRTTADGCARSLALCREPWGGHPARSFNSGRGLSHLAFAHFSEGKSLTPEAYTPPGRPSMPHSAFALFSGGISVRSMPRARLQLNYKS